MASFIYDLFHRLHCFISVAIGIIGYIADFGVAFLHHCIRDLSNIRGVEIFLLLMMVTFSYSQTPLIRTLRVP